MTECTRTILTSYRVLLFRIASKVGKYWQSIISKILLKCSKVGDVFYM